MDIEKKLNRIFAYVGVNFNNKEELKRESLVGIKIGMKARDLLIVFFLVEKVFQIRIPENLIVSGEFNTYMQILDIIKKCISVE